MDELDSAVGRALATLKGEVSPETEVRLSEDVAYGSAGLPVRIGRLHSVAEFRARFSELVIRGWPWINVHAVGLLGGNLVIAIELPNRPPSGASRTSVNVSGPTAAVKKRGYVLDDLLQQGAG